MTTKQHLEFSLILNHHIYQDVMYLIKLKLLNSNKSQIKDFFVDKSSNYPNTLLKKSFFYFNEETLSSVISKAYKLNVLVYADYITKDVHKSIMSCVFRIAIAFRSSDYKILTEQFVFFQIKTFQKSIEEKSLDYIEKCIQAADFDYRKKKKLIYEINDFIKHPKNSTWSIRKEKKIEKLFNFGTFINVIRLFSRANLITRDPRGINIVHSAKEIMKLKQPYESRDLDIKEVEIIVYSILVSLSEKIDFGHIKHLYKNIDTLPMKSSPKRPNSQELLCS